MRTLSEMFNVNYFLVSQTNPHIVPALNLKKHFNRKLGNLLEQEWKHRQASGAAAQVVERVLCSKAIQLVVDGQPAGAGVEAQAQSWASGKQLADAC